MRFHTLNDWLEWQETLHPEEIELGLERVACVWNDMQAPLITCPIISVAGTNGKGSSIAMLQATYLAAGYRVGAYTSPHLYRYNERICIDGEPVADELIIDAFQQIDAARLNTEPETSLTYFEFGTLAALQILAQAELDVILLEVGLGGRLDAVNIVDADVALITSIDLDHQAWLGNTREEIAREKAGIMRANKTCVISAPDTPVFIEHQAKAINCTCYVSEQDFSYELEQDQWRWQIDDKIRAGLPIPALNGKQQCQNAAGVLMAAEALQQVLPVTQQAIRDGLLSASLPGRFEIRELSEAQETGQSDITVILDVAHNPAAAQSLAESISAYKGGRRVLCLFSILADKDVASVIRPLIPYVSHWSVAPVVAARGMPTAEIEQVIGQELQQNVSVRTEVMDEIMVKSHTSAAEAFSFVQNFAKPGDIILVYGSFYIVAEVGVEPV